MSRKSNMCRLDQLVRLVIAGLSLYLPIFAPTVIDNIIINGLLFIFGVVNGYAAVSAFCPVYHLANVSTLSKN